MTVPEGKRRYLHFDGMTWPAPDELGDAGNEGETR